MTPQEVKDHSDGMLTPAVLRLVNKAINNDKEVVLLSRMNRLPWYIHYEDNQPSPFEDKLEKFLELLRSHLPEDPGRESHDINSPQVQRAPGQCCYRT